MKSSTKTARRSNKKPAATAKAKKRAAPTRKPLTVRQLCAVQKPVEPPTIDERIKALLDEAYQEGHDDGHEEGYSEGYDDGYSEGLDAGSDDENDNGSAQCR